MARAHGIRGEVRVVLHDPQSSALDDADEISIGGECMNIAGARPVNDAVVLALKGVTDRNRAELLRGRPVSVKRESLQIEDDEVLLADLVGFRAILADGSDWGEIVGVELGAHQDRLVVESSGVRRELPLVDEFVGDIDVANSQVIVMPPDGLPEEPAP